MPDCIETEAISSLRKLYSETGLRNNVIIPLTLERTRMQCQTGRQVFSSPQMKDLFSGLIRSIPALGEIASPHVSLLAKLSIVIQVCNKALH